ncbi:DNA cytosine methyltransferase [Bacillus pseudomycoides]|uniref:DNA cytosine methyltransferase n=1 Tax=Bacillus pseudomycoides TaxID=64104 RepID=UPI0011A33B6A|nr:DNA cytosine methyltransferase [Bacillus pseudomycoides]
MGLRFLDMFGGVGGFGLGMEEGGEGCVGLIERDKFGRGSYEGIDSREKEWRKGEIKDVR